MDKITDAQLDQLKKAIEDKPDAFNLDAYSLKVDLHVERVDYNRALALSAVVKHKNGRRYMTDAFYEIEGIDEADFPAIVKLFKNNVRYMSLRQMEALEQD